jgi:hypothetical protein
LGVESLVPEQLLFLGKTPQPERYVECLRTEVLPKILSAGMDVNINLQLGIPDESYSQRQATLAELSRLGEVAVRRGRKIVVNPQLHVIYPGTPHFGMHVAAGTFGSMGNEVFEQFTRWEADRQPILEYFGKHFAHGNGGIPIGILDRNELQKSTFKIEARAIDELSSQLVEMEGIAGISVFKYGEFLTPAAEIHPSDTAQLEAAAA